MFKVGGKVLCVNDTPVLPYVAKLPVKKGGVYTVNAIGKGPCKCFESFLDLGFKGLDVPGVLYRCPACGCSSVYDGTWWLGAPRFIPLSDMQTELSTTTINELLSETVEV